MNRILLLVLAVASMRCQVKKDGLAVPAGDASVAGNNTSDDVAGSSEGMAVGGQAGTQNVGGAQGLDGEQGLGGRQGLDGSQGDQDARINRDMAGSDVSRGSGGATGGAWEGIDATVGSGGVPAQGGMPAAGAGGKGGETASSTSGIDGDGGAAGFGDSGISVPDSSLPDSASADDSRRLDVGRDRGADSARGPFQDVSSDLSALPDDAPSAFSPDAAPDVGPQLTLVWSDDFDGDANTGVDTDTWSYATWGPQSGGVNNELQQYTTSTQNVFLDGNGHMVLRALKQPSQGAQYTSGRIESKRKFSSGGRIEVSAQLPAGRGAFPGIVMLGTGGNWPAYGEIALMEQYGQPADKGSVYVSAYADSSAGSGDKEKVTYAFPSDGPSPSEDFHIYSVDWYTDHLVFQIDGNEVMRTSFNTSSPFYTTPEYIALDLAIGGNMGGTVDPSLSAFPMDMLIDYVKVYSF